MFGIVAFKGNQISRIDEIMQNFGYKNYFNIHSFDSYFEMEDFLYSNYFESAKNNKSIKGLWFDENWTYLYDPELVDPTDTEAVIKTSKMFDCEIHCLISEPKSGTFVYAKYNDIKIREVFYSSNKLVDNNGFKLEEEVILDLSESLNEEELIKFSKLLGLNIFEDTKKGKFNIGEFDLNLHLLTIKSEHQPSDKSKKWWKFW